MDASDKKELRVILDNIDVLNDEWFNTFPTDEGQTCIHDSLEYEIVKANKILAKPPLNCEVGTAEEQANRFHNFCVSNSGRIDGMCDRKCPCIASPDKCHCLCKWSHMPYEEGGAK